MSRNDLSKLRYSLIHPKKHLWILDESVNCNLVGGNKIRKLGKILRDRPCKGLLSYGSPFSSHILATAFYGARIGVPVKLVVIFAGKMRDLGEYPSLNLARELGAELTPCKNKDASSCIDIIRRQNPDMLWIPGGGHTWGGLLAYKELTGLLLNQNEDLWEVDTILLPFGTGTTAMGFAAGLYEAGHKARVVGVSVSRSYERCIMVAREMLREGELSNLTIDTRFEGKYGCVEKEHVVLRKRFFENAGVRVDPIYNIRSVQYYYGQETGKCLFVNTGGNWNMLIADRCC